MNKRTFFIMLFICSNQSVFCFDFIKAHAQKLLVHAIDDAAIESELTQYSLEGLQELKQILMDEKARVQHRLNNKNKIRAVAGVFSIIPGSMVVTGILSLRGAWLKLLGSTRSFSFSEYFLGIPGEAAISKSQAKALGVLGTLLSIWGAYLLSYTLPRLCSTFDHEMAIAQKTQDIIAVLDKEIRQRAQ